MKTAPKPLPGSDEEKARQILAALAKAQPERAPRRYGSCLLIFSLLLIAAIVAVVLLNRPKFALLWRQLTAPESLVEGQ